MSPVAAPGLQRVRYVVETQRPTTDTFRRLSNPLMPKKDKHKDKGKHKKPSGAFEHLGRKIDEIHAVRAAEQTAGRVRDGLDFVRRHPARSVLAASLVGYLVGRWLKR